MIWLARVYYEGKDSTQLYAFEFSDDENVTASQVGAKAVEGFGVGDIAAVDVKPIEVKGSWTRLGVVHRLEIQP